MELASRERGRPFNEQNNFRKQWKVSNRNQPERYPSKNNEDFSDRILSAPGPSRRGPFRNQPSLKPYQIKPNSSRFNIRRGNNPALLPTPNTFVNRPKPLISSDVLKKVRATLAMTNNRIFGTNNMYVENEDESQYEECNQYEDNFNDRPSFKHEPIDENEYLREEEETKQKIEEIILVAQALREKIEREEDIRKNRYDPVEEYESEYEYTYDRDYDQGRSDHYDQEDEQTYQQDCYRDYDQCYEQSNDQGYDQIYEESEAPTYAGPPSIRSRRSEEFVPTSNHSNIPSLLDLPPIIPNLMDLNVEPPDFDNDIYQSNRSINKIPLKNEIPEKCWNCQKMGHRFMECRLPKTKRFCYRCGKTGFNVSSCPDCNVDELYDKTDDD